MKIKIVAALVAATLILSLAIPALAQTDTDTQTEPTAGIPIRDPYLEEYLPCTNARYRAWFGAS